MALAVDSRQNQYPQYTSSSPSTMAAYDSGMRYSQPNFTNPWASSAPVAHRHSYATALPTSTSATDSNRYTVAAPHANNSSAAPGYSGSVQLPAPSMTQDMKMMSESAHRSSYAPATYTTASSAGGLYAQAPVSASGPNTTASYPYADRRPSHPFHSASDAERQSYNDALDASRGMVAMSQSDITPRNIYGGVPRASTDAYGFPSTHSAHSSISSASTYPSYYNSSVSEASVGDYSSASESIDVPCSRTLPRPNSLVGGGVNGMPPAPQSMMGQFSSKISSSSQKKHKCKICDKRFTRPSSLQTHIYSHTGEKPFACDVEGCGRQFSVVSNLRRHRKVHKGDGEEDDHPSPGDSIDEM